MRHGLCIIKIHSSSRPQPPPSFSQRGCKSMYFEIRDRWQVFAGSNRRGHLSSWPWVQFKRFGGSREWLVFGWVVCVTDMNHPGLGDDDVEPVQPQAGVREQA